MIVSNGSAGPNEVDNTFTAEEAQGMRGWIGLLSEANGVLRDADRRKRLAKGRSVLDSLSLPPHEVWDPDGAFDLSDEREQAESEAGEGDGEARPKP